MSIDVASNYYANDVVGKPDDMVFFSDIRLSNKDIMDEYNRLIVDKKYDEANNYLSQQDDFFSYSADFFNLIENRIKSLQEYLLTKTKKNNPFIYSNEEPSNINLDSVWITEKDN